MNLTRRLERRIAFHVLGITLLVGGFMVHLAAQSSAPAGPHVEPPSLMDRWLSPDAVIGGVLVILYVGELRGDVKRLKAENAAMQQRLHDDYLTKELATAMFHRKAD
jgi:hypothetical protein